MTQRSTPARRTVRLVALVVLAVAWFSWMRPTQLGGRDSYVVVQGSSMEPTYHDGDLVLVREEDRYAKGDVIAFRAGGQFDDPTRVIHRIVGPADEGGFVTQGDNRDRVDPWEPGPDDIIGRAVLHVPYAGAVATAAVHPRVLVPIAIAATVLGGRKRRRKKKPMVMRPERPTPDPEPPVVVRRAVDGPRPPRWRRHAEPRWAFVGLVATLALLLPILLGTWSALRASDTRVDTEHLGEIEYGVTLDYRFLGDASAVYPDGLVETTTSAAGALVPADTLYSRLLHRLEMALSFRADGGEADRLVSSYAVDVLLTTPGGWSTPLEAVPATPFQGRAADVVVVDLDAARLKVEQVGELTGLGGDAYTVTVTPRLEVEGGAGSASLRDQLVAPVTFMAQGGVITTQAVQDSAKVGELTRDAVERARYGIGPLAIGTQAARGLLGGMVLVLLAAAGWFASVLFGGVGLGESARIAARYRSQVVDVAGATAPPGPVVMVSAIDELARLAKLEQSVILHEDLGDGCHRYRVFLGAVTYEYETAPEHPGGVTEPESDAESDPAADPPRS